MHPILFNLFGKEIYTYGVMAALGFLAAILTWTWLGRQENRPEGFAADLGFWLMTSGIIGSRIAYVIANWSHYRQAPAEIIRIDQGGLVFYGGLILASGALAWFARRHRLPLWHVADFAIPGLAIGHALGRIGCFFNGCCYGRPVECSVCEACCSVIYPAVSEPGRLFPGTRLYSVQLFEAAGLLVIWLILVWIYPRRRKDGAVFALYLLLYPPCRFLLEFIRGDARLSWVALNSAQVVSLALLAIGILLWRLLSNKRTA